MLDDFKEHYLPILKRNSNSTLNFKVFERAHSKEPKLVRYSKMDNNLPKIGTIRDVSSHRNLFDVKKKADLNDERPTHRLGKENAEMQRKEGMEPNHRDKFQRFSQEIQSVYFKRNHSDHNSIL